MGMKPGIDGAVSGDLQLRHLSLCVFFIIHSTDIY